jgi:hypothetical protein
MWGTFVENELALAVRDPKELRNPKVGQAINRRRAVLERIMETPVGTLSAATHLPAKKAPSQFRDPAMFFRK